MHILNLPEGVDLGHGNLITAGEYVLDDVNAAHLLVLVGRGRMEPLVATRPFGDDDWSCKRILFMRAGGYGDLVLMTPVLREVKHRWPTAHVAVSTMANYAVVLAGLPFVDEVVPYPLPKKMADEFDAWVFYENAIEHNPRAKELHMTELFGEIAGITEIENLRPEYRVKPSEAIWCNEAYPRVNGTRRICIQFGASAVARVYPHEQLGQVCTQMVQKGWEVFLLGAKGEVRTPEKMPPLLRNLAEAGLTFRQSCAVVNTCDCFVGSDSALLHVAGALEVPAVGLYGPFPWKLRTAHSPTTFALQGEGKCSPCFHHVNAAKRNHFPDNCPSRSRGHCEVLASIKPDRVVAKAEQVMRKIAPMADALEFPTRN